MEIDTGENLSANTNFFTYDAMNSLYEMDEFENIVMHNENVEIILVPFKINLNGKHPFNTIMLVNENYQQLSFANIYNSFAKIRNKETLLSTINCYLYQMFSSYANKNETIIFDEFVKKSDFKGLCYREDKMYVFIDLTKLTLNIGLVNKDDLYWFVLMDEILNKKKVCNLEIKKHYSPL